jgi:transcription elongation factor Elf1
MNNSIKTFECMKCNKEKKYLIWKKIQNDNIFMCELCWKKFNLVLDIEILERLKKLNI